MAVSYFLACDTLDLFYKSTKNYQIWAIFVRDRWTDRQTDSQTHRQMLQDLTLGKGVHNLRLCYDMIMFQTWKCSVQWMLRYV